MLLVLTPHWSYLENHPLITVLFDGAHDYISPTWYGDPTQNVPTWNYSTVLMHGKVSLFTDQERLLQSVLAMAEKFETDKSWETTVDKNFLSQLSKGIVGIEIELIGEIQSKFKLSQNRSDVDRKKFIEILSTKNSKLAKDMENV